MTTVYLDGTRRPLQVAELWRCWPHAVADIFDELPSLAARLGLRWVWAQGEGTVVEHGDVIASTCRRALGIGAVPVGVVPQPEYRGCGRRHSRLGPIGRRVGSNGLGGWLGARR